VAEHNAHAAACIQAAGGCAAAQTAANNFYNNVWGTDLVVNP
jgi:hypothetical protein